MELTKKIERASQALTRVDDISVDQLAFAFEGIPVKAVSTSEPGSRPAGGKIKVLATVGKMYFTVESPDQRIMAFERIKSTNRGIDGAYKIDRDGIVYFESLTATQSHVTGQDFMTALTLIILEAEPHLRAIQSHLKPV